jgi:hypothetical protein
LWYSYAWVGFLLWDEFQPTAVPWAAEVERLLAIKTW